MEGALILPYYNDTINQTWGKSGAASRCGLVQDPQLFPETAACQLPRPTSFFAVIIPQTSS